MKIPALFKADQQFPESMKKEYSSTVGTRSSAFYEWNEVHPVEVVFHAKKDSELECIFLQNLPLDAALPAKIKIIADRGAKVKCTIVHQGSLKAQITLESICAEENSNISIQALTNSKTDQKHSLLVHSLHPVPHTQSDLKVWAVANDYSQSVFHGIITIEKGAHHTEAFQKNRNLMLSEKAVIDSIPQLFIFNDEVKCAHGSSTSSLDPEQYIYLQSRGINKDDAEAMITQGFMESAIDWIENETVRTRLQDVLNLREETL